MSLQILHQVIPRFRLVFLAPIIQDEFKALIPGEVEDRAETSMDCLP